MQIKNSTQFHLLHVPFPWPHQGAKRIIGANNFLSFRSDGCNENIPDAYAAAASTADSMFLEDIDQNNQANNDDEDEDEEGAAANVGTNVALLAATSIFVALTRA